MGGGEKFGGGGGLMAKSGAKVSRYSSCCRKRRDSFADF